MEEKNNNFEEKILNINGQVITIPNELTFEELICCEMKGLNLKEINKNLFSSISIIYSTIRKISVEEAIEELSDSLAKREIKLNEIIKLLDPLENFFIQSNQ